MNWCRICRKEAASSSLSNNFGPTPDIATHLCPSHFTEWQASGEHRRWCLQESPHCFVAFVDFVHRTYREGKILQRELTPEEVKAMNSPPAEVAK